MFKVKGKVLTVSDEVRPFNDKDKDGNKLQSVTNHRVTHVTMLVKVDSRNVPVLVKGWDLPSTFQLPVEGADWETPDLVAFDSRFKAIPELSI